MKTALDKGILIGLSISFLFISGSICVAGETGRLDMDAALNSYGNGDYDAAGKALDDAITKDGKDVWAVTLNAIVKMEVARNNRESDPATCRTVAKTQYDVLNRFYGMHKLFVADDKLYSFYLAAYGKAYWLNNRPDKAEWYINKSIALYPKNYEALDVKGQIALGKAPQIYMSINNPADSFSIERNLKIALESFSTEMDAAGNDATDIKSRAAYWAAFASHRLNGATDRVKALLEESIKAKPGGKHAGLSKAMLEKRFSVK